MTFSVSVLATGSELLDGRVVDTNSNFVARALSDLGVKLKRVLVVDDDMGELLSGLRDLSSVSDLVITSGGLGPTADDLTRDLVAQFFGVGLSEDPGALQHLEEFCRKRNRSLDAVNRRQAALPVGSTMIPNQFGTAPGFMMSREGGATVCSLSGVPREFKRMFTDTVLPFIQRQMGEIPPLRRIHLKTFGLPESLVGSLIERCSIPSDVVVSYRATFPEVHVVLKAPASFDLSGAATKAREALGRGTIFTEAPEQSFVERLQALLVERNATISTAESCTGGMISEFLTRTPGSSAVFVGGIVSYRNDIKERLLRVPRETLEQFGAVSAEVAGIMAREARASMGTTYSVSVTGVAGPDGGSAEKPVGTFFVGVAGPSRSFQVRCSYISERHSIRNYASYVALDLVRREILGLEIPSTYPILPAT